MKKFKMFTTTVAYLLLAISAVFTIEEVVSVAYVGVQASILSKVALYCLLGSATSVFVEGLVETLDEACVIIKDMLESLIK